MRVSAPHLLVAIKVRLPLQRAWTLLHISSRACRRERGGDKCAALCERRQEATQHVRIQMLASPSHLPYWCVSTHSFNCVCLENNYLAGCQSGGRAGVNAAVRRLYSKWRMELHGIVQILSYVSAVYRYTMRSVSHAAAIIEGQSLC